jgi:hypothetical protein
VRHFLPPSLPAEYLASSHSRKFSCLGYKSCDVPRRYLHPPPSFELSVRSASSLGLRSSLFLCTSRMHGISRSRYLRKFSYHVRHILDVSRRYLLRPHSFFRPRYRLIDTHRSIHGFFAISFEINLMNFERSIDVSFAPFDTTLLSFSSTFTSFAS